MAQCQFFEITNIDHLEFVLKQLQPGSKKTLPFQAEMVALSDGEEVILDVNLCAPIYQTGGRYEGDCVWEGEARQIVLNTFLSGLPRLFID